MTCPVLTDDIKTTYKTPTKDEYKSKAFLMALLHDAEKAVKYAPMPQFGKDGNSKIHHRGSKAMTLVYSGLAWHDCMPTAGCNSCYAMKFNYLNNHGWRKGSSYIYSYMARFHPELLGEIIEAEIRKKHKDVKRLRMQLATRIHEAGDYLSVEHVKMWHRIIKLFPDVIFWAYTRSDIQPGPIQDAILEMAKEPNLHIRASQDPSEPNQVILERNGMPSAVIVGKVKRGGKKTDDNPKGKKLVGKMHVPGTINCPEQMTFGKVGCADCGLCWHPSKPVIRFWEH